MCGFIGKISLDSLSHDELEEENKYIICRGPDVTKTKEGISGNYKYKLLFNRLSIIDLSSSANQPIVSDQYNTILMFNGEIYNHNSLRTELIKDNLEFKTDHSDSEVVLNGLSKYGSEYLSKLRGQFSIAFFNLKKNSVILARDRMGQKPLYYFSNKESLIFGSDFRSLRNHLDEDTLDFESIYTYLNFGSTAGKNTISMQIKKVLPSEFIEFKLSNTISKSTSNYWNIKDHYDNKKFSNEEFFEIFSDSVSIRQEADVPVANFLSGGIDSTSIIKNQYDNGLESNTFSVHINNEKYDESFWSNQVVQKYNTNHQFIEVDNKVNFESISDALNSLDEPYSDPSVIPSYLISNKISKHFKVAISGDGGDELFGGYTRTINALKPTSRMLNLISSIYNIYPPQLGTGSNFLRFSNNVEKKYNSYLEDKKLLQLLKINDTTKLDYSNFENTYKSLLNVDYTFYLPDQMLFKVDRTSMANSIEVRSPFVDHLLVEYIFSHSTEYFDLNKPKKILKNYLSQDFDDKFLYRKKQGFVFDLENWVYGNLSIINEFVNGGEVVNNLNSKIVSNLSINKSRINALRIWRLFVLEYYLSNR